MYNEENFLQLSGIQHFAFCRRQWALAYIELQWQENVRTVEGKLLHENAHDASIKEKRGDLIVVRVQTATFCGQQGRISRPVRAILSGRL